MMAYVELGVVNTVTTNDETAVTILVIFVKLVDVGAMLLKLVEVEDGTISLKWRLLCNRPV